MTGVGGAARILVVMGVSGAGKSTIAAALGDRLGWPWEDADVFHPPENVAKMSRGVPLTDDDRWPWLHAIRAWIDARLAAGECGIVTCSALRRAYRDVLVGGRPEVRLVHLFGDRSLIAGRLALRRDHFMPPGLLDSQFAALEAPDPDEAALEVPVTGSPDEIVARILASLALAPAEAASGR